MRNATLAFVLSLLLAACGGASDGTSRDAGVDVAVVDAAGLADVCDVLVSDAPDTAVFCDVAEDAAYDAVEDVFPSTDADTAAHVDAADDVPASPPAGPFGSIEGPCLSLDEAVDSPGPSVWINTYVFDGDPFDAADLDADALTIFELPNAGGSSKCSEVFSMEVMDDCLDATLHATETEVTYLAEGAITDYVIVVGGERIGVSVTRAYRGPYVTEYGFDDALELLTDKLEGVNESTANVAPEDAWTKQILHVWTLHADWAGLVAAAWEDVDPVLQADTIVLVTVETGSDFVVTDSCDD